MKPYRSTSEVFGHLPNKNEEESMRSTAHHQFNASPNRPPRTASKIAGVPYRMNFTGMNDTLLHTVNEVKDSRPHRYQAQVPVNPTRIDTQMAWS